MTAKTGVKILSTAVIILCCALAVSAYYNFKTPFLQHGKQEHLGQLTYKIPTDGKWIYSDYQEKEGNEFPGKNGYSAIEACSGKVTKKSYIELDSLMIMSVGYRYKSIAQQTDPLYKGSWSGEYGKLPDCISGLKISTDAQDIDAGTYWYAEFKAGGKEYEIDISNEGVGSGDVVYTGEEIISSIAIDESQKDEFEEVK